MPDASPRLHHLPGRLRLWLPQIRKSPQGAQRAEATLVALAGVLSVRTSLITGSVLINYHPAVTQHQAILAHLEWAGYALSVAPAGWPGHTGPAGATIDRITDALVEKALERSAVALLAAFL